MIVLAPLFEQVLRGAHEHFATYGPVGPRHSFQFRNREKAAAGIGRKEVLDQPLERGVLGRIRVETVTLLNASPEPINLAGWQIADRLKNKFPLSGTIVPGATLVVKLSAKVQLGNKGGIITLLNDKGLKVDGVSYTAEQARKEGWTIVW